MAIIIVAIVVLLVLGGIFLYIRMRINDERKILRNFYDILFITKFFYELKKMSLIETILNDGTEIFVTRKFLKTEIKLTFSKIMDRKKENLAYTFKIREKSFEIYGFMSEVHKKLVKQFSDTKFVLVVRRNKIEVFFSGPFEDFICVSSIETIIQSLLILLDSEYGNFKKEEFFFCSENELKGAEKIIEQTKDLLLNMLGK